MKSFTPMRTISIVIPAYNEEVSIGSLLNTILSVDTERLGFTKEIIVVNDGSKDKTEEVVRGFSQVRLINQNPNQGRGCALKRGIDAANGQYILFQDADLEYDPHDYPALLAALGPNAECIYGNRLSGVVKDHGRSLLLGKHPSQGIAPWAAALAIRAWTSILVGTWVPDMFTGYKLYPAKELKRLRLTTRGFELDHEITVKLYRLGVKFGEVPIRYYPRTIAEGKKIRAMDGIIALWTVLCSRVIPKAQCIKQ